MKKSFVALFCISISSLGTAQNGKEKEIVAEGTRLYRSEMASWYGTDIFLERFKNKRDKFSGYLSYVGKDTATCIFLSRGDNPKALVSIVFDSTYNVQTAVVDSLERELTILEKDLYTIKKTASEEIRSDTVFKYYNNTSLNLIPLSDDDGKRVYVLTGPKADGVVLFGNDYLISFDAKYTIKSKLKLHNGLIPIDYLTKDGKLILSTIHTHLPEYSDYITATDICTLRLYEKFAKWQTHYVISKNLVSIWECEKNQLVVLTRKAWDKISATEKALRR